MVKNLKNQNELNASEFDLSKIVQPIDSSEELYIPYLDEIDEMSAIAEYNYSLQYELDEKKKKAHKAFTQLIKKQKREAQKMAQAEVKMKAIHQKQITKLFEKYYGALPKDTQNIF